MHFVNPKKKAISLIHVFQYINSPTLVGLTSQRRYVRVYLGKGHQLLNDFRLFWAGLDATTKTEIVA